MSKYDYINPFLQVAVADGILKEVFSITGQLKMKAFLALGTCLGFFRDGGYIEGDHDLDFGVICKWEIKGVLTEALKENGFILKRTKPRNRHILFSKNKILLDIWFRTKSEKFYSEFDYVEYKGRKYPVPHPTEGYLRACYSNWKEKEDQITHYFG